MTLIQKHFVLALLLAICATTLGVGISTASARPSHSPREMHNPRANGELRVTSRAGKHVKFKQRRGHVLKHAYRGKKYHARKHKHSRVRAVRNHVGRTSVLNSSRRHARNGQAYRSSKAATRKLVSTGQPLGTANDSQLVSEARRWIGGNPTTRRSLWCARFMNFVLRRLGFRGTGSDMARSFASYGRRISGPKVGAIAVMSRGRRGGHVGVVSGVDARGNPIVVSGNHGNRVAEARYARARVYAYVLPSG
jgi:uncharacterized protein (TIGR02594 family)